MVILAVLLISLLVFRAAGALGISAFAAWDASARYALAVMFALTASAHFTRNRYDLAKMVPQAMPYPMAIIYFTGVCEIAGAIGILLPHFRGTAGICLFVLLIAMFPANIRAARERLNLRGKPATQLWLRLPMQIFFLVLIWWSTQR
jgi:uncharacterized membrane protein